jgi:MFS family permease
MSRAGASHSGQRWLILVVLCAVLSQTGLNLARPLISYRIIGLGGDALSIGLVTATYAVLPVLVAVPLGRVSDRTRRSWLILAAGTGLLGVGSWGVSAMTSVAGISVASAILGLGHLVFMIAAQGAVANLSPYENLDRNFGWFTAAVSLGQLAGPALSGLLLGDVSGPQLGEATKNALLVAAVTSLAALPLAVFSGVRGRASTSGRDRPGERPSSLTLVRLPGVASSLFVSLALLAAIDLLTAYLPLVAEGKQIAPAVVGVLLAIRAAASIGSRLLLARLLHGFSRRTLVTASCTVTAAALLIVSVPGTEAIGMGIALGIGGFFLGLGQPLTMTQVVKAVPETARSTTLALRLLSNRVGQVGLPFVAGLIAGPAGAGGALWLAGAVLAAAGVVSHTTPDEPNPR